MRVSSCEGRGLKGFSILINRLSEVNWLIDCCLLVGFVYLYNSIYSHCVLMVGVISLIIVRMLRASLWTFIKSTVN